MAQQKANRWSTRQIVIIALFVALSVILAFIEIPLPFLAPFLKYDASFVPAIVGALGISTGAGCVIGLLASLIHMLVYGDIWGGIMNIIAVLSFCLICGPVYDKVRKQIDAGEKVRSAGRLTAALIAGSIASIAFALLGDILVIPIYMGVETSTVIAMLPVLAIFNLIKVAANSVLSALVYRAIRPLLGNR